MIHVAGVIDEAEAELLIECGVGYLGFPLALAYHQEDLSVDDAAAIVRRHGDRATFFLITYLDKADRILSLCHQLGVAMVQLHGEITTDELGKLRQSPNTPRVLKSLIVRPGNQAALADQVPRYEALVDGFITDTFDPDTGATGATGKTHDWAVSRHLVGLSTKPVILAGGLNPDNVSEAIAAVRPAGVDAHTGLEGPDGRKQRDLVARFVREASQALGNT